MNRNDLAVGTVEFFGAEQNCTRWYKPRKNGFRKWGSNITVIFSLNSQAPTGKVFYQGVNIYRNFQINNIFYTITVF